MRMSELSAFTQDPSGNLKAPFSRTLGCLRIDTPLKLIEI